MAKAESGGSGSVSDELTLAHVLDRLARISEQQAEQQASNHLLQREQLKQTRRKSNQAAPLASVFNPRGEKDFPMPKLKCEVLMPFPQRVELHGLDREEVELMNVLIDDVRTKVLNKEAPVYSVDLNDGSAVQLCIEPVFNRTTQQLERIRWCGPTDPDTRMPTPFFTTENRQQFRPLRNILRDMLPEEKTAGVMTMKAEYRKVAEFAKLDPINRTALTDAFVEHADASHTGPLAFSTGE